MLEHLGAFGIHADALSHCVIAKGALGWLQPSQKQLVLGSLDSMVNIEIEKLDKQLS